MKPKKSKSANRSDSDDSVEHSRARKKEKLGAVKSAIVQKKGQGSDSESPAQWSGDGK